MTSEAPETNLVREWMTRSAPQRAGEIIIGLNVLSTTSFLPCIPCLIISTSMLHLRCRPHHICLTAQEGQMNRFAPINLQIYLAVSNVCKGWQVCHSKRWI